jgi:hypothetical protein
MQAGSGAETTSYLIGIKGSFHGIKQQGCGAGCSPPFVVEVKNGRAVPPFSYSIMACCLMK